LLAKAAAERSMPMAGVTAVLESVQSGSAARVGGTAVFLDPRRDGLPRAFLHNLKHNRVLHSRVIFLSVRTALVPHIAPSAQLKVVPLADGIWRVFGEYGYMDEPDVPALLSLAERHGVAFRPDETTYFLSRDTVLSSPRKGMARWRERLFGVMVRNARSVSSYFRLPPNRVVELGAQVEI
jgi:KUP system potassium uptake protein